MPCLPEAKRRWKLYLSMVPKENVSKGHNWGWGVGDDLDDLMAEYGFAEE